MILVHGGAGHVAPERQKRLRAGVRVAAITGGSAGLIAIDAHERVFVQLSATMPVAWVDATGAGDSLGDRTY